MQTIKFCQVRIIHTQTFQRWNRGGIRHKLSDRIDVQRDLRGQQMSQSVGNGLLTFVRCQIQNFDV